MLLPDTDISLCSFWISGEKGKGSCSLNNFRFFNTRQDNHVRIRNLKFIVHTPHNYFANVSLGTIFLNGKLSQKRSQA